jgi:hypothetical protein
MDKKRPQIMAFQATHREQAVGINFAIGERNCSGNWADFWGGNAMLIGSL